MELFVQRTTLLPGAADTYRRVHAEIPEAIAAALREAGVVRYSIWCDGDELVHVLETRDGFEELSRRLAALDPIDPEWDEIIGELGSPAADATLHLEPIWAMTPTRQVAGDDVRTAWSEIAG